MPECRRCDTFRSPEVRGLERHLVDKHLLTGDQAKREATLVIDDPVELELADPDQHACPKCGTVMPCDWRAISVLEAEASRLKIIAGMWRAKLLGVHIGRPKTVHFDIEEARALVASGLSLRATGRKLGVHSDLVRRAIKANNA